MKSKGTKGRGRTSISNDNPGNRWSQHEHKTQATRPVSAGAGPRRGDRRDTNPAYTGNVRGTGTRAKKMPVLSQKTRKG